MGQSTRLREKEKVHGKRQSKSKYRERERDCAVRKSTGIERVKE
jgi:hypothetical protein